MKVWVTLPSFLLLPPAQEAVKWNQGGLWFSLHQWWGCSVTDREATTCNCSGVRCSYSSVALTYQVNEFGGVSRALFVPKVQQVAHGHHSHCLEPEMAPEERQEEPRRSHTWLSNSSGWSFSGLLQKGLHRKLEPMVRLLFVQFPLKSPDELQSF